MPTTLRNLRMSARSVTVHATGHRRLVAVLHVNTLGKQAGGDDDENPLTSCPDA